MFLNLNRALLASLMVLGSLSPGLAQSTSRLEGSRTENVTQQKQEVVIDWTEGVVEVKGTGTPPDRGTLDQRRLMAERSATADAYRQLAEVISEIRVTSETIVRDFTTESDTINTYVSALIKGAQKLDQRYLDDGTVEVYMAVKMYSPEGLSGILQPHKQEVPPPPVELAPAESPGAYTGVIIDCRGLGLSPAMSPAILSEEGGELYLGQLPVSPDFVIKNGIVGYARSLMQARKNARVGKKPLIIKGLTAAGNFRTDVVISEEDTRQLMGLDKQDNLLSQSRVIFVL